MSLLSHATVWYIHMGDKCIYQRYLGGGWHYERESSGKPVYRWRYA